MWEQVAITKHIESVTLEAAMSSLGLSKSDSPKMDFLRIVFSTVSVSDLKMSRICPNWGQSNLLWAHLTWCCEAMALSGNGVDVAEYNG